MSNYISGLENIAAYLNVTSDELRDAILYEQVPIFVMDGQLYASRQALTHWLNFGGNPELGDPHPGRDAFVVNALNRANLIFMEKAS
ncbi:MAG: hypothetical protein ACQRW7_01030 [Caulobacterales bacterium]|uniref:hypothetical protein n=1 Tax=Glycocaulis sp. TaxID=1969725 RepID=UPI003F9FF1AB